MLGLEAAREVPCAGGAPKSSLEPKASPKAAAACGGAEVESTRGGRGNYGTYRPITTERTCAGAEVMSTPPRSCRSSCVTVRGSVRVRVRVRVGVRGRVRVGVRVRVGQLQVVLAGEGGGAHRVRRAWLGLG